MQPARGYVLKLTKLKVAPTNSSVSGTSALSSYSMLKTWRITGYTSFVGQNFTKKSPPGTRPSGDTGMVHASGQRLELGDINPKGGIIQGGARWEFGVAEGEDAAVFEVGVFEDHLHHFVIKKLLVEAAVRHCH